MEKCLILGAFEKEVEVSKMVSGPQIAPADPMVGLKISLCGGDFTLSVSNGRTILNAIVPTPAKRQIAVEGAYPDWPARQWGFFLGLVQHIYRNRGLEDELKRLEEEIRKKKIAEELPIVEGFVPPYFWAAHFLELHVSREGKYIRIVGHTYPHRAELRRMGFTWDARLKAWGAQFSEELMQKAVEFVKRNDKKTDPIGAGMVRCEHCSRWTPPTPKTGAV